MQHAKPKLKMPLALRFFRSVFPVLENVVPFAAKKTATHFFYVPLKFKTPQKEYSVLSKAKLFTFQVEGIKSQGYYWQGGSKLIILVHGWAGRATQYYMLIPKLLEKGFSVASFDAVGHGKSEGKESSVLKFAEGIQQIAALYGKPYAVIGHSLGGVASILATNENLGNSKLITISAPTLADDILKSFRHRLNGSAKVDKWLRDKVREEYSFEFDDYSAVKLAKELKPLPYLIIHDEKDREAGIFHAKALAKVASFASTYYTHGNGHTRILTSEAVIDKIITFLKE